MILVLMTLLGCTAGGAADDSGSASSTAADGGTGTGLDGGSQGDQAVIEVTGDASVDLDSYVGTERFALTDATGTELCAIRVDLASTATRDDCPDCVWAFDVAATGSTVELDQRCADGGLVAKDLAATPRAYGYAEEYIGHSSVLMVDVDGRWQGVAYAGWDQASGAFSYTYDQEELTLP
ncbi:MAG: hypothetical protein GXP62_02985 [Oligoflexia bacterium]|nr:hypothetical protein [Oligoflexia bacterium]